MLHRRSEQRFRIRAISPQSCSLVGDKKQNVHTDRAIEGGIASCLCVIAPLGARRAFGNAGGRFHQLEKENERYTYERNVPTAAQREARKTPK